jgi:hypothetical protein
VNAILAHSENCPRSGRNLVHDSPEWQAKPWDVNGHSIRVGVTQDMLALNIDLASVMQVGRWKTTAMPMRYGEDIQAGLGGMARTAKAQGRVAK